MDKDPLNRLRVPGCRVISAYQGRCRGVYILKNVRDTTTLGTEEITEQRLKFSFCSFLRKIPMTQPFLVFGSHCEGMKSYINVFGVERATRRYQEKKSWPRQAAANQRPVAPHRSPWTTPPQTFFCFFVFCKQSRFFTSIYKPIQEVHLGDMSKKVTNSYLYRRQGKYINLGVLEKEMRLSWTREDKSMADP